MVIKQTHFQIKIQKSKECEKNTHIQYLFFILPKIVSIICYAYYINYLSFINHRYNCNYNMNTFLSNSMKKIYEIGVNKKKPNPDFFLINRICNVNTKLD